MLRAGDWFIFDPTTPHLVIPRRPNRRCLLILLQVELLDRTEAERRAILEAFPVLANDADAEYMAVA